MWLALCNELLGRLEDYIKKKQQVSVGVQPVANPSSNCSLFWICIPKDIYPTKQVALVPTRSAHQYSNHNLGLMLMQLRRLSALLPKRDCTNSELRMYKRAL